MDNKTYLQLMKGENIIPDFEFMNRRFWIVNAISPNLFYWETFTAEHMMGLPYLELPDMTNLQVKTPEDLNKFLLNNNIYNTKEEVEGICDFFNNVKENDVVALQQNNTITLIGLVCSNYIYVNNDVFSHRFNVAWGFCNVGIDDIIIMMPKNDLSFTELKDKKKMYEIFAALSEMYKCNMS